MCTFAEIAERTRSSKTAVQFRVWPLGDNGALLFTHMCKVRQRVHPKPRRRWSSALCEERLNCLSKPIIR